MPAAQVDAVGAADCCIRCASVEPEPPEIVKPLTMALAMSAAAVPVSLAAGTGGGAAFGSAPLPRAASPPLGTLHTP